MKDLLRNEILSHLLRIYWTLKFYMFGMNLWRIQNLAHLWSYVKDFCLYVDIYAYMCSVTEECWRIYCAEIRKLIFIGGLLSKTLSSSDSIVFSVMWLENMNWIQNDREGSSHGPSEVLSHRLSRGLETVVRKASIWIHTCSHLDRGL